MPSHLAFRALGLRAAALTFLLSLGLAACGSPAGSSDTELDASTADASAPDASQESADASVADDAGQADAGEQAVPADHTLMLGGVAHRTGNTNPLSECTACHGSTLQGGSASSCYTCHDTSDHTLSFHRVPHKSGTSSTCEACHGPANGGGLGPACTACH